MEPEDLSMFGSSYHPKKQDENYGSNVAFDTLQSKKSLTQSEVKVKQKRFSSIEKYLEAKQDMIGIDNMLDKGRAQVLMRK